MGPPLVGDVGPKSCLLQVCSKLNLQVQKALERAIPSLVRYARQAFSSTRFCLFLKAFPTFPPSLPKDIPCSSAPFPTKDPLDLPRRRRKTLHDTLRSLEYDSACAHARSCFPVIYLLSFRHSSYSHSDSSTSSLEQTGGPSTLFSPGLSIPFFGWLLTEGLKSEFGLPNFKKLAPADKTHLWIAACDVLALVVFIWQVIDESLGGPTNYAAGLDALAAVRLWLAGTVRATCVFIIIAMTLLHVRLARPVDFGKSHWLIWAPGLLLIITSTIVAGKSLCSLLSVFFDPYIL